MTQSPVRTDVFDEDYFIRGKQSGKSLYENYRWLPELTIPMCRTIADHCEIEMDHSVLDFGCARGYSVRAFRELGFDAWGEDVSDWALTNADPAARQYVGRSWGVKQFDWIIAKDVLEHIPAEELSKVIAGFFARARHGVFIVVPLCDPATGRYVVPEYEADITHVIRWPLWTWAEAFLRAMPSGWTLSSSYRIKGVKDNYSDYLHGNGFIVIQRTR